MIVHSGTTELTNIGDASNSYLSMLRPPANRVGSSSRTTANQATTSGSDLHIYEIKVKKKASICRGKSGDTPSEHAFAF